MAASQRWHKATLPTEPAWPLQKRAQDPSQDLTPKRKAAGRRRRFAMLVVVPVLLMLGSVYLHTVAAALDTRVAELSAAERIRALAAEKLGMHEPKSTSLKVYGDKAEDGTHNGAPQRRGSPR